MPTTPSTPPVFPVKTALAIATVAALLTTWRMLPFTAKMQPTAGMDWRSLAAVPRLPFLTHKPTKSGPAPKHEPEPDVQGSGNEAGRPGDVAQGGSGQAPQQGEDDLLIDNAGALDGFYAGLARLEAHAGGSGVPGAGDVTVVHFGDSPTTADLITGDVRQMLQARFGDAGQGFNLIAKPWAWYQHFNIDATDSGWKTATAVGLMREGAFGVGGATFDGSAGATAEYKLKGSPQDALELAYEGKPDGGAVDIDATAPQTGSQPAFQTGTPAPRTRDATDTVMTLDTSKESGLQFARVALPPGTHAVQLKVARGSVRLYGVLFDRATPGVQYESIGLNGATTSVVARALNEAALTTSFAHLKPSLVIINFGTNESSFGAFVDKQYEGELRLAIARVRQAGGSDNGGVNILIMSPMDRGERSGGGIETMATIPRLVDIQRRVAADTGCAFFNTFEAMGGDGTMQRWYEAKPRLVGGDLIHPSPAGARIVATAFVEQLMQGYARYKIRMLPSSSKPAAANPTGIGTKPVD